MTPRGYAVVAATLGIAALAAVCSMAINCQTVTADIRKTCIEAGNPPLECERVHVGQ